MTRPRPPRRPCSKCEIECRSESGVCWACQKYSAADRPLRGGRWVTIGLVRRWKPWTDEECAERTRRALQLLPAPTEDQLAARRRSQIVAAARDDVA